MNMLNPSYARHDLLTVTHSDLDHVPVNRRVYLSTFGDTAAVLALHPERITALIRSAIDDDVMIEPDVNLAVLDACAVAVGCDSEPDGGYRFLESLAY